jgi:hypothetical protein
VEVISCAILSAKHFMTRLYHATPDFIVIKQ